MESCRVAGNGPERAVPRPPLPLPDLGSQLHTLNPPPPSQPHVDLALTYHPIHPIGAPKTTWSGCEDELLMLGLSRYGNDWAAIVDKLLPSRSEEAVFNRQKNLKQRAGAAGAAWGVGGITKVGGQLGLGLAVSFRCR